MLILKKIGKKGFIITPIIFIAFILIAVVFSLYVSEIDKDLSQGIRISATVDKSINDIYKKQINQINFAKLAAYDCTETTCYSAGNRSTIESCIDSKLRDKFNENNWNTEITGEENNIFIETNLTEFQATNINMSSDRSYQKEMLHKEFLNIC